MPKALGAPCLSSIVKRYEDQQQSAAFPFDRRKRDCGARCPLGLRRICRCCDILGLRALASSNAGVARIRSPFHWLERQHVLRILDRLCCCPHFPAPAAPADDIEHHHPVGRSDRLWYFSALPGRSAQFWESVSDSQPLATCLDDSYSYDLDSRATHAEPEPFLPPSPGVECRLTSLLQWTRRMRVCLQLCIRGGAPLSSVVKPNHRMESQ